VKLEAISSKENRSVLAWRDIWLQFTKKEKEEIGDLVHIESFLINQSMILILST
jgi:hypothetical protein